MIRAPRLTPGARIALVAPASGIKPDDVTAGAAELARLGFEAVWDEGIFARTRFEAGAPALRARIFQQAWDDPTVSALIAVRGGYGSAQLLPLLDWSRLVARPKLLVGYSDLTALLSVCVGHGLVSIHGAMIEARLAAGPARYDEDSFVRTTTIAAPLGALSPDGVSVLRPGTATGLLTGGTLAQLVTLLGTPWAPVVPDGAVLFLEDIGERPYRVHRMLTQMAQAGLLRRAAAIVFGEFPGCDEPGGTIVIRDVLADFVADFTGPVLFGFPSGHTVGRTWTLPFGVVARVDTRPPTLTIEESAVA